MVIAYSYIRFSSPKQAEGDSLRRQIEATETLCRERGWALDTTLTLRDLGVSAWTGRNAVVGNLRTFLDAITAKSILPCSVLVVESLDRITRQGIDEGYDLIKRILKAGVRIVTLGPLREFDESATKSLSKGAAGDSAHPGAGKRRRAKGSRSGSGRRGPGRRSRTPPRGN